VDAEKPVIVAPGNFSVANDPGECQAKISSLGSPTASDACGVASVSNNHPSPYFPVGNTVVVWTATDIHGNVSDTVHQLVTVMDNEMPTITVGNTSVNNDAGVCGATVILGIPVNGDNCGVASVVNDHPSTSFPVGVTDVHWTVTDVNGWSKTVTQKVTVTDTELPVVHTQNITVTLVNGVAIVTAADVNNGSSDNCGIASMQLSKTTFNCSNTGVNTVTLTVTDVHGNQASANATVTVTGAGSTITVSSVPTGNVYTGGINTNLYLGYGASGTVLQTNGAVAAGAPYTYSWTGGNIGMLSSTSSASPVFTPTAAGYYTYTVTVTNKYGCSVTASISICVTDIRVPGSNGKVYVCHAPPGNPANRQTLSISVNAVAAHLGEHPEDRLGSCGQSPCNQTVSNAVNSSTSVALAEESTDDLKVTVMPNPSNTHFTLKFESRYKTPINLRVLDASGRVVDARSKIGANSTLQIGSTYSSGKYFAEVIQGGTRKVVQLIKGRG
jgi:hypothetical protein